MRRGSFLVLGSLLAACAGGAASSSGPGTTPPLASGEPDSGGQFVFTDDAGSDASVLLSSCTPGDPSTCPTGFTCYATHTSSSWWVNLYGKCTFGCTAQTLALCSSFDGVCGCPVSTDGGSNCSDEGGAPPVSSSDAGALDAADDAATAGFDAAAEVPAPVTFTSQVCVPAVKPGTQPGANEGNGGCGTPGCGGGGEEAGALPDAGSSDQ